MTYKKKQLQDKVEILRKAFRDRRIRLYVRGVMEVLGYTSTAATLHVLKKLVELGEVEYDEQHNSYYLR